MPTQLGTEKSLGGSDSYFGSRLWLLLFPIGYFLSIFMAFVFFVIDETWNFRQYILNRGWFARQPAMRENRVPLHSWPLHAVAVYLEPISQLALRISRDSA